MFPAKFARRPAQADYLRYLCPWISDEEIREIVQQAEEGLANNEGVGLKLPILD